MRGWKSERKDAAPAASWQAETAEEAGEGEMIEGPLTEREEVLVAVVGALALLAFLASLFGGWL